MFYTLSFFWFIREIKAILFWLYFWQLKEYHIGRFIDHFRTEKGKRLLFNKLFFLKIIFLISFFIFPLALPILVVILYLAESFKVLKDYFSKTLKFPVWTKKTIFLILVTLIFAIFYLNSFFTSEISQFSFRLLIFDIFTPVIVSAIVILFQPLAVLGRNQIIRQAKKKKEKFKDLLVIGITGSYGKTSTKEFLTKILSEKFKVLKTKAHQNSEIGISQCILNDLKPEHEIFVVEMGAYNQGGIKLLCEIAKPKIGIVTGVNEQHLATFGSMENLLSAEGGIELIESLPRSQPKVVLRGLPIDSMAFFNARNKYCFDLYKKTEGVKKFLYGENTIFLGQENILGAMMIAKELGMTDEEISRGAEKIKEKFPGIEIKKGKNGLNIIDATYSSNPTGVMAHLEYLKTWSGPEGKPLASYGVNKKVIVMPCLIELGSASKEVHKRIGEKIGQVCDLAIITTKDKFREIKDGSTSSTQRGIEVLFIEDSKKIAEKIKNFCQVNDVVLLEGRIPKEVIELLSN